MNDDVSVIEFLDMLDKYTSKNNILSYEAICKLSPEQHFKYMELLGKFEKSNSLKGKEYSKFKGDSLEEITTYLMEISGNIFYIKKNIRTGTNEVDLVIELNEKGKCLLSKKLIPLQLEHFICECKNHGTKIGVTYTGKLGSLMQVSHIKLGLLISYHGVSGKNWTESCGLIKKFYLSRERLEDRFCIIDFNIKNFVEIANGANFLQIIHNKLESLQLDTDYKNLLSRHPNENLII